MGNRDVKRRRSQPPTSQTEITAAPVGRARQVRSVEAQDAKERQLTAGRLASAKGRLRWFRIR